MEIQEQEKEVTYVMHEPPASYAFEGIVENELANGWKFQQEISMEVQRNGNTTVVFRYVKI